MTWRRIRSSAAGVTEPVALVLGGISLLRPFDKTSVSCHLVTLSESDIAIHSRRPIGCTSISNVASDNLAAIGELRSIAAGYRQKPVLFYGNDVTMRFLSAHREELSEFFLFLMPEQSVLEACGNKILFEKLVRSSGIDLPATYSPSQSEDLGQWAEDRWPLVIKPALSTGKPVISSLTKARNQKAVIVSTAAETSAVVARFIEADVEFVAQEFISGDEDMIYSYHAFVDQNFEPLADFVGRKIRTYPVQAGESSCIELVHDEAILDLGPRIVKQLEICGPVKLDFKRDTENGRTVLLEVNPRFTLWNYLGAMSGVNLPLVAFNYLTGNHVKKHTHYETGKRWVSLFDDYRSFRSGCTYKFTAPFLYFARNPNRIYRTFAWGDPLPALYAAKSEAARIVRSWMS